VKTLWVFVYRYLKKRLPFILINYILQFVPPGNWESTEKGKEFRKLARHSMVSNKSGWGWINWGNCGTAEFTPSLSIMGESARDGCNGYLNHTESE